MGGSISSLAFFAVAAAGIVGLLPLVLWARRSRDKIPLLLGAGGWIASVAMKVVWAVALNHRIHAWLGSAVGTSIGDPIFYVYVGLLTGVFEVGLAYAIVRTTRLRRGLPRDAVSFGVAFGSVEAITLSLVGIVGLSVAVFFGDRLPADTRAALLSKLGGHPSAVTLVAPAFERVSASLIHLTTCVLVVLAAERRELRWFWIAFIIKTATDAFAAWAVLSHWVGDSTTRHAAFELIVGVFAWATAPLALHAWRALSSRLRTSPELPGGVAAV